jgi:hypothetical protein
VSRALSVCTALLRLDQSAASHCVRVRLPPPWRAARSPAGPAPRALEHRREGTKKSGITPKRKAKLLAKVRSQAEGKAQGKALDVKSK